MTNTPEITVQEWLDRNDPDVMRAQRDAAIREAARARRFAAGVTVIAATMTLIAACGWALLWMGGK